MKEKKIAVLIPCYNEAVTIEKVIKDYKKALKLDPNNEYAKENIKYLKDEYGLK